METKNMKGTNHPSLFTVNFAGVFVLVATLLLLVGIFASVKTAINMVAFTKYPTSGVLSMSFFGPLSYQQREEDCTNPQIYYSTDNKIRQPTKDEKENEMNQQKICINSVGFTREATKVNDVSLSIFFLFLGVGLLITKKIAFR